MGLLPAVGVYLVRVRHYYPWLSYDTPPKELKAMLRPYPAEVMNARLANPMVNTATVDGPECLLVADDGRALTPGSAEVA